MGKTLPEKNNAMLAKLMKCISTFLWPTPNDQIKPPPNQFQLRSFLIGLLISFLFRINLRNTCFTYLVYLTTIKSH